MAELILKVYLSGCVVVVLGFGLCFIRVRNMKNPNDAETKRVLKAFLLDIGPRYIFIWPWSCVISPLYMLFTGKLKRTRD